MASFPLIVKLLVCRTEKNLLFEPFKFNHNGKKVFLNLRIIDFWRHHCSWSIAHWLATLHEACTKTFVRCIKLKFSVCFGFKVLKYWRCCNQLLEPFKTSTLNFLVPQELVLFFEELPVASEGLGANFWRKLTIPGSLFTSCLLSGVGIS